LAAAFVHIAQRSREADAVVIGQGAKPVPRRLRNNNTESPRALYHATERPRTLGGVMRTAIKFGAVLATAVTLLLTLCFVPAAAQEESTSADDGAPASSAPADTNAAPTVPIGANLPTTNGALPSPPLIPAPGQGHAGSSSVSAAPGTQTTGIANAGDHANRERRSDNAPASDGTTNSETDAAPVATCADYPTWYDAQLALESSVDSALNASLDPDGNTIACEEYMYPSS
jgi:hypothetical protein